MRYQFKMCVSFIICGCLNFGNSDFNISSIVNASAPTRFARVSEPNALSDVPLGAKDILNADTEQVETYHIGLKKDDLKGATYAILVADQGCVSRIADKFDNPQKIGQSWGYISYLGSYNGQNVLIMSTGIGGPVTAIAVEELSRLGINNFFRVGSSGGMQLNVNAGDLVVATGAVRQEGTSKEYAPIEYPAVPNFHLTASLYDKANELVMKTKKNLRIHTGIVHCKDSFYGQHSPEKMPVSSELMSKWDAWKRLDVLCSEMETASLFTVASKCHVNACALLLVIWNQEQEKAGISQDTSFDPDFSIEIVSETIKNLLNKNS